VLVSTLVHVGSYRLRSRAGGSQSRRPTPSPRQEQDASARQISLDRATRSARTITQSPKRSPGPTARDAAAIVRMPVRGGLAEPEERLALRPVGLRCGSRYSWRSSESPISQIVGGHKPTNRARRSAFPRSS
jgi:hypothetical protein